MGMVLIKDGKLLGKRGLRLATLDDVLNQTDMLMKRSYQKSGEWSLGQICQHLSYGIIFSIDGHPFELSKVMVFVNQTIFSKKKVLREGFKPGFKMRGPLKQYMPDPRILDEEGVDMLNAAVERLKKEGASRPSPMYGKMNEVEWEKFHLRHAEHHLAFLHPHAEGK